MAHRGIDKGTNEIEMAWLALATANSGRMANSNACSCYGYCSRVPEVGRLLDSAEMFIISSQLGLVQCINSLPADRPDKSIV